MTLYFPRVMHYFTPLLGVAPTQLCPRYCGVHYNAATTAFSRRLSTSTTSNTLGEFMRFIS